MIQQILTFLQGKKAYIVAAATILGAIAAILDGQINVIQFIEAVLAALGLGTLRAAVSKTAK